MMKIVLISDTHGRHRSLQLPPADWIIHAGDLSSRGTQPEVADFMQWYDTLRYTHKVLIAGNHDFLAEDHPDLFRQLVPPGVHYLEDELLELEGLRIWGSPITPFFHNWAFNRNRGAEIKRYWDRIPDNIDILLTHGPAYGILDRTFTAKHVGCEELAKAMERIQPQYHVFGHIHEAYGMHKENGTTYVNASQVNLWNVLANKPVVVEW